MLQTLPPTTTFLVQFDDSIPKASDRAKALLSVVESEFSVLTNWFAVTSGFGPTNRVTLLLNVLPNPDFAGLNHGYDPSGAMTISFVAVEPALDDATDQERVKSVFVAEFSELLMSYNMSKGSPAWNSGHSDGEALSQFCARERFPAGYLSSPTEGWLHSPLRPDWVSQSEPTDREAMSFGCGLLFLYYLKTQLGFTPAQIIQHGGATLEATYQALVGQAGGFAAMTTLLDRYLPLSNTLFSATTNRVDIFPLLDTYARQVSLQAANHSNGIPRVIGAGEAPRRFLGCPAGTYGFKVVETHATLICTARTYGFGQPQFKWSVNAQAAINGTEIAPLATVYRDPLLGLPSQGVSTEIVPIDIDIANQPVSSTLTLSFPKTLGQIDLFVEVSVVEFAYEPSVATTGSAYTSVATRTLRWGSTYYEDAVACLGRFIGGIREIAPPFDWMNSAIAVLRTLPDPPPDLQAALRLVSQLSEMQRRLESGTSAHLSRELKDSLVRQLGLRTT